ncbi:hypothetical protein [Pseudoalteromonas marina]|uniref:Uncharacterized protein n=2 Tax=Bacteria TaxID=2 RepID=A0ABT9FC30_9GAMM|nr:hypothetical protein [Pseudoalteromonas marina]MDP2564288.1 hypothetical protein [Pseudoalteromonas marina]
MENTVTPTDKSTLANIANQAALSLDAITSAKKEWFPAALALLPVIYKPELLKKLGYNNGATAYFKDQSNALGLKQTTLANIKNTFQKVIAHKKLFKNIDIKNVNVSILTNLFNKAKASNAKGQLTEANIKAQIKKALEEGVLTKTDINYVEDIDQQIEFTKSLKIVELDETDPNYEIILQALDGDFSPEPAKETQKITRAEPAKTKEQTTGNNEKTPKDIAAEEEAQTTLETTLETAKKSDADVAQAPKETKTISTAKPISETTESVSVESTPIETQKIHRVESNSEIINHFRELNIEDKELIGSVAAAMVGDQTEALLLSLPANKQTLLIEMIKRIKG